MKPSTPSDQYSLHDAFLQNFNNQIEKHLSDSSLCVKKLLRLIGMSRTDLHRKLSRATGMSATQYVRHIRLQHAAILLKEQPHWSIYQIALEVGFESQSYFTKKFKEHFGICPMAFRAVPQATTSSWEHL